MSQLGEPIRVQKLIAAFQLGEPIRVQKLIAASQLGEPIRVQKFGETRAVTFVREGMRGKLCHRRWLTLPTWSATIITM